MPITLGSGSGSSGTPVIKRLTIGEEFRGVVVDIEPRDMLKDGKPVLKDNGRPRQELVVHLLTMPGTTMSVGLKGEVHVPDVDEACRAILPGGAYGQWIEAESKLPGGKVNVGDLLWMNTTHAETYDISGRPTGRYATQAEVDAHYAGRKSGTVGMRGDLKLARDDVKYAEWVAKAEAAYYERQAGKRTPIVVGGQQPYDPAIDESPF